MIREMKIGGFPVGPSHPPLFFAEIGSFFNGRPEPARELIQRIIACRDAVPEQPVVLKTEILDDPEICLPGDTIETYASKAGGVKKENYRELIERKVMKTDDYIPLFKMCRDAKIPFVVSVYDMKAAKFAKDHGAAGLKIASSNLTHVPLIRYTAGLGQPMVIDTGRASIAEVHRAIDTARKGGCFDIVVQHRPKDIRSAKSLTCIMQTYAQAFGLPSACPITTPATRCISVALSVGAREGHLLRSQRARSGHRAQHGHRRLPRVLRMVTTRSSRSAVPNAIRS